MEALGLIVASVLIQPFAVPLILISMLLWAAIVIGRNTRRFYLPTKRALETRISALRPVIDAATVDEAHSKFAADFPEIDAAMSEGGNAALVHAWVEYRQTIVGQDERVLQATTRPYDYFLHLAEDARVLGWWANLFIAVGLTFTFLGIIGALAATSSSLAQAGGDSAGMSAALTDLLRITAAKFWTSVVGVGSSIVLRIFDRRWHRHTLHRLEKVADAIERGTVFLPPQRIATDQLFELKEQSTALKEFSSKLAVGIADALEAKMQPVVAGLSGIQSSIDDFKSGSFDQIGKELGQAISSGAGAEMSALAGALTAMTNGIASVNERLDASGAAASDQIAAAAREFSAASKAMTTAFVDLNGRMDAVASRLAVQLDETARGSAAMVAEERARYTATAEGHHATLAALGDGMRAHSTEALTAVRTHFAELSETLTRGVEAAADRNADVLSRAASTLETASGRAAEGMSAALDASLAKASAESERAMRDAFQQFGTSFETASGSFIETLRSTAGRMEALAGAIERSANATDDHANVMTVASREASATGASLGVAATAVANATTPLRQASEAIQSSIARSQTLLSDAAQHHARHAEGIERVATSLAATSETAQAAWRDYRARFEAVDKALGEALDKIAAASAQHATNLNKEVGRIDAALAGAIDKLNAGLEPLGELAANLEDAMRRERGQ